MAKRTSGGGLSLRKKDATKGGGGTEGAVATITEIQFVGEFTYGGRYRDKPSAALCVVFEIEGFDKPWEQNYSVGPSKNYEVIADGDGIKGLGKGTGLNDGSPAYLFLASVEDAAEKCDLDIDELLPELEDGGNSVRPLEGKRVRLTNVKASTVGGDEKEYIVVAEFLDDADEKPSRGGKSTSGKAAEKTKGGKGESVGDRLTEKTVAAVEALIEEHTSIKKSDLANYVYDANRKDADAKAMMQLCFKESWIADDARPWQFDRKKGVLRASD